MAKNSAQNSESQKNREGLNGTISLIGVWAEDTRSEKSLVSWTTMDSCF